MVSPLAAPKRSCSSCMNAAKMLPTARSMEPCEAHTNTHSGNAEAKIPGLDGQHSNAHCPTAISNTPSALGPLPALPSTRLENNQCRCGHGLFWNKGQGVLPVTVPSRRYSPTGPGPPLRRPRACRTSRRTQARPGRTVKRKPYCTHRYRHTTPRANNRWGLVFLGQAPLFSVAPLCSPHGPERETPNGRAGQLLFCVGKQRGERGSICGVCGVSAVCDFWVGLQSSGSGGGSGGGSGSGGYRTGGSQWEAAAQGAWQPQLLEGEKGVNTRREKKSTKRRPVCTPRLHCGGVHH